MTSSFAAFAGRRAIAAAVFVLIVSAAALVLARLAPGDATSDLFGTGVDQATLAQTRAKLGLDRPIIEQLGGWAAGLARFDLGTSSLYGQPVSSIVMSRAPKTAELALLALLLATALGIPIGILAGARPDGWLARVTMPVSIALIACPPLVTALALVLLAVSTHWMSVAQDQLLVPVLALALPTAAMIERLQAQAMSEAFAAPDLVASAARGLPPARLLWVHAARQSLRPVLGVYGVIIGSLFSGSLAVEIVTGWPGMGRLMFDALVGRDVFLVTGCVLFGAICLAAGNFMADLLRAVVDPRAREHA